MSVGTVLTAISLLKDAAPYLGKLAEKFLNGEITVRTVPTLIRAPSVL